MLYVGKFCSFKKPEPNITRKQCSKEHSVIKMPPCLQNLDFHGEIDLGELYGLVYHGHSSSLTNPMHPPSL